MTHLGQQEPSPSGEHSAGFDLTGSLADTGCIAPIPAVRGIEITSPGPT
jgi:hypothetical protein